MKNLGHVFLIFSAVHLTADYAFSSPIVSYRAAIKPDFVAKSIEGNTTIALNTNLASDEITFPVHELKIDKVELNGKRVAYRIENGSLVIALSASRNVIQHAELNVSYHGQPKSGLVFGKDYVYSAFSTCRWMICDEELTKHPIEMNIVVPKDFKVVASGELVSKQSDGPGFVRYTWKQTRPYSSYLFGFAAGPFNEATEKYGAVDLRYLGIKDGSQSLKEKFQSTARAMKFFEDRSGVEFPHTTYTQVLVPNEEAQEMTSFSVIGNEVLDPILQNPQEDWSIVHELAHQWWGNLVTCKSWKEFWLNEGITVFMTAAYKQNRWGEAAYQNELELARKRYQKAVDAGLDVPLTYEKPYPSIQIKRAIVYSKGALFMDALRKTTGEDSFWRGVRNYTKKYAGQSVESRDFQTEMEAAYGKKLDPIFNKWVY